MELLETDSGSGAPVQTNLFATMPPRRRVVSLRNEHGGAFRRLVQSPANTAVAFELTADTFPAYLRSLNLNTMNPMVALRAPLSVGLALELNGVSVAAGDWSGWTAVGDALPQAQRERVDPCPSRFPAASFAVEIGGPPPETCSAS